MNSLRDIGFHICIDNEQVEVNIGILASIVDMPVKASIMYMALFDGSILCRCRNKQVYLNHAQC